MSDIFLLSPAPPPINLREVLRYAGCAADAPAELFSLAQSCAAELEGHFTYRVCYTMTRTKVCRETGEVCLGELRLHSVALAKNLDGCQRAVVFAATVGIGADRLTARYSKTVPSRGVMMQAVGAERIEALCDTFEKVLEEELGAKLKPRFSPGYGDLTLEVQRNIFALLEPHRRIGLTLNGSLLMSPTKSVTAIIGIKE